MKNQLTLIFSIRRVIVELCPFFDRRKKLLVFTVTCLFAHCIRQIPYNGIFSRRQIFVVLSQKHDDYCSRILIFAVGNVREKSFWFFSAKIVEWVAQLDFPSIEQLCGKKISGQSIWNVKNKRYLQSDRQTNKNNIFTFRRLNKMTVENKTMKCLSCLLVTFRWKQQSKRWRWESQPAWIRYQQN